MFICMPFPVIQTLCFHDRFIKKVKTDFQILVIEGSKKLF